MTTALYRRYRPEAFSEMIGQSQVTDPLMTALRADRVGHAYLFSGPRGCGKTTSARILARCLNCAQGPTDTPCGECDSCIELGRGGGGSLDVVEIDAASHNGVDDARDLRERAVFAPARDRFKIFILDEAHMVTPQGFNALLKLVEEPPDHVKFIFATTEPEKVIGTIRSRTHHYPFRLVPPAAMLEYVEELCAAEGVVAEAGVLALVVRAGGGSPRDTLSLLDQLIAGSEDVVTYERAIALLGYTHAELLDTVVTAFASSDGAAVFRAVDRVVQTGQDPRRFVDDLLERLRDLIVIAATGSSAASVLRGVSADDLARLTEQANRFGAQRLSQTADVVVAGLDEMTGATSPRLQLELLCARVLALGAPPLASAAAPAPQAPAAAPTAETPVPAAAAQTSVGAADEVPPSEHDAPPPDDPEPASPAPSAPRAATPAPATPSAPVTPVTVEVVRTRWSEVLSDLETVSRTSWVLVAAATVTDFVGDVLTLSFPLATDVAKFKHLVGGAGPSEDLRTSIKRVLGIRVKYLAKHDPASGDSDTEPPGPVDGGPDGGSGGAGGPKASIGPRAAPSRSGATASAAAAPVTDWAVAPIPTPSTTLEAGPAERSVSPALVVPALAVDDEPEDVAVDGARGMVSDAREGEVMAAEAVPSRENDSGEDDLDPAADVSAPLIAPRAPRASSGSQRYGEAVVRQVLNARYVGDEPHVATTRFS